MATNTKLFNAETCVIDMLNGVKITYPALLVNNKLGLCMLNEDRGSKVALLSGGGSGHAPFPCGYVAKNMLSGSVSGSIFTAPPVANIYSGIDFLSKLNGGGVLVVIMNYADDKLNFGLAIEHAKDKGIQVECLTINDDCALLGHETLSIVGRRGISGCTFVFKILGNMANINIGMSELKKEFSEIQPRLASIGACIKPCSVPISSKPLLPLGSHEISLGLGIHGEVGRATLVMSTVSELVENLLKIITKSGVFKFGKHVCVMIGNLGSSTQMECFIMAKEVYQQLSGNGMVVERLYVGTVMSSLDAKGYQITILNVTDKATWFNYLDEPTEAFGWPGTLLSSTTQTSFPEIKPVTYDKIKNMNGLVFNEKESKLFRQCVILGCAALKANMEKINELDSAIGDGDCGTTLAYLADGILVKKDSLPWKDLSQTLGEMSMIAESLSDETIGAVYSLLLQGASTSAKSWKAAWSGSLETLYKYSDARIGHRTLVDALAPACTVYNSYLLDKGEQYWKEALRLALEQANHGCSNTLRLKPKLGKASYADHARISSVDAGAFSVVIWLTAVTQALL